MDKRALNDKMTAWLRTGPADKQSWAYEYWKAKGAPVNTVFLPEDIKESLLKAVAWWGASQKDDQSRKRGFTAMQNAWRQRENRRKRKDHKSCTFVLSTDSLRNLKKLAGRHPQNEILDTLIKARFEARDEINVERDLSEKQLAAARNKMNGRINGMQDTVDYQKSTISLLMDQIDVLIDKNSRYAVLLDANGLTDTPLSLEQEADAKLHYAAEMKQINKLVKGRPQSIAQRYGTFAHEVGKSRLQLELEQQRKLADEQITKLLEITKTQQKARKFLNTLIAGYSSSDAKDPPEDTNIPTASPQEAASSKAPDEAVLTNIDASAASPAAPTSTSKSPIVAPADHPGIPENNSLQRTNETMPSAIIADPARPADTPAQKPDTHKKVSSTHLGRPPKQISPAIKKK